MQQYAECLLPTCLLSLRLPWLHFKFRHKRPLLFLPPKNLHPSQYLLRYLCQTWVDSRLENPDLRSIFPPATHRSNWELYHRFSPLLCVFIWLFSTVQSIFPESTQVQLGALSPPTLKVDLTVLFLVLFWAKAQIVAAATQNCQICYKTAIQPTLTVAFSNFIFKYIWDWNQMSPHNLD